MHPLLYQCVAKRLNPVLATCYNGSSHPEANLLLSLSLSPNFQSNIGAGHPMTMPRIASKEFPHPYCNAAYIYGANRGKLKAAKLRNTVAAPIADAA